MTKEALDLALEALERMKGYGNVFLHRRDERNPHEQVCEAITAIKQARSAPVQSCYCPNCEAMGKELAALKAQPAVPLTDDWIRSKCKQTWVFETAKQWVRMTEEAHGITAAPVQEPDELKHIGEQDSLLDVDESAWHLLVENRGGCRCHISPPCSACSNPISEEEMNEVGYTYTTPPAAQPAPVQEPTYTTGHCKEKAQPGGCQLHNLHCGYPACDRKAANTLPAAQQEHEPENEPHVSLASVQEPYGYVWFTKHMEHRFTRMKPHPDMGAMDIRPVYTTPPAQPAPAPGYCKHCKQYSIEEPLPAALEQDVFWGVDWGKAGDKSCVSIIKRLPNGKIEVVAVEYEP